MMHNAARPAVRETEPIRNVVVFCIDASYLLPCAFMIDQLAADPATRSYDVLVIHQGIEAAKIEELVRRAKRPVGTIAFDRHLIARIDRPWAPYLSEAVYLRLCLDTLLPPQYRRILYVDADMYFERHEIARLFALDLGGAPLAAVDDALLRMELLRPELLPDEPPRPFRGPDGVRAYRRGLGLADDAPYFNSGLMLIDRPRWNALEIDRRAVEFLRAHPERCPLADQSALNAVAAGQWVELSPRYNFQTMQSQVGLDSVLRPVVRHFVGPHKPWNSRHWPAAVTAAYRAWFAASGRSGSFVAQDATPRPVGRHRGSWVRRLGARLRRSAPGGAADDRAAFRRTFAGALLAGMRDAPFVDLDAAARAAILDQANRR